MKDIKEDNSKKIILDLCGGTGSWSKPYKEAGYDVRVITLPQFNVLRRRWLSKHWRKGDTKILQFPDFKKLLVEDDYNLNIPVDKIYGILAAPPCTMFSFARTNAKTPRDLEQGMKCVRACLDIIWKMMEVKQATGKKTLPLKFWALENPARGFLKNFLGKPAFTFNPYDFGDPYKKETALWGSFNEPTKSHKLNSKLPKFDYMKSKDIHPEHFGKFDRQTRRSITPAGFANAFFKANP